MILREFILTADVEENLIVAQIAGPKGYIYRAPTPGEPEKSQ
jgi:hypothetical protein